MSANHSGTQVTEQRRSLKRICHNHVFMNSIDTQLALWRRRLLEKDCLKTNSRKAEPQWFSFYRVQLGYIGYWVLGYISLWRHGKKMLEEDCNAKKVNRAWKGTVENWWRHALHVEVEEMNNKAEFHQTKDRMANVLLSLPLTVSQKLK